MEWSQYLCNEGRVEIRGLHISLSTCVGHAMREYAPKTIRTYTKVNYHPKYAKIKLIQLEFVDNVLLFYMGDLESMTLMNDRFQKFLATLGLVVNVQKSDITLGE